VTQPTQEQQRAMMEDFHDSAQRAGETLAAAVSVEAEARAAGGGPVPSGSTTPEVATGGGASRRARLLHRQRPEGAVPSGSGVPLVTPPPSRRSEDAIAIHETPSRTRPATRGLHRGQRQRRRGRSTRARHDRRSAVVFRFVFGPLWCTLFCLF
jgi:hypothetical protein